LPPSQPATTQAGSAAPAPRGSCKAALAGYGKRSQGVCFDTFEGGRGPDLVVVPAGGSIGRPFAVGRGEVSSADYGVYCSQTGRCSPPGAPPPMPITSISLADAQRYTEWLSQVTGATYRLPTDAEWTHAASAAGAGSSGDSSINCVVELGGKRVRGNMLDGARSGTPNGWGLYNYVGNAQEWTSSGGSVSVRGGAFTDNLSMCTPAYSRPHSGKADAVTGFRVVRELK